MGWQYTRPGRKLSPPDNNGIAPVPAYLIGRFKVKEVFRLLTINRKLPDSDSVVLYYND
jgi:hypothetical protein